MPTEASFGSAEDIYFVLLDTCEEMLVFPVVRASWKQVDVLKCDAYEIGILG